MPHDPLTDETVWGVPGAIIAPPVPGAKACSATPLLDLLRVGASHDPEAIALVSHTASLRYKDMLRLAQTAARAIADRVPPGHTVACLLPRSPESVAALLGCLLSGRICMVLDPSHPAERQAMLLADAAPSALLLAEPPPFPCAAPAIMLRDVLAGPDRAWRADSDWNPNAPLAVYFTSGSSGRPKGIVLSARSVLYRARSNAGYLEIGPGDRVFGPAAPITAAGLSMLLGTLTHGARAVLASTAQEGAGAVLRLIEREQVTHAIIQPSLIRLWLPLERAGSAFRSLRRLRIGSSALPRQELADWRTSLPSGCVIWHAYGSTEALIVANYIVPPDDAGGEATVAAGILEANHDYALLDDDDRPVAFGEPGELVLRSRYVALGEWRDGHLVPGRLPPVPGRPGWRFYRTGDLMRVRPDGMLHMLGRADRQVKIHGVRIEPAEIEAVLRAEPGVTDAAVVADRASSGVTLHGFVAAAGADHGMLIPSLRQRLVTALPMTLRPARLTVLDRLPLLPGGKTDLVALARLAGSGVTT